MFIHKIRSRARLLFLFQLSKPSSLSAVGENKESNMKTNDSEALHKEGHAIEMYLFLS